MLTMLSNGRGMLPLLRLLSGEVADGPGKWVLGLATVGMPRGLLGEASGRSHTTGELANLGLA